MQIAIVNSHKSIIPAETEFVMLWSSLLLGDQVICAGNASLFIHANHVFETFQEKGKLHFIKQILPNLMKEKDDREKTEKCLDQYLKFSEMKKRDKDTLILHMKLKKDVNSITTLIKNHFNQIARLHNLLELKNFITGEPPAMLTELISFSPDNPYEMKNFVDIISRLMLSSCLFILDKNVFDKAESTNFNEVDNHFNEGLTNHFSFGELCILPEFNNLSGNIFSVLRKNLLMTSESFRSAITESTDYLLNINYEKKNFEKIVENYRVLESQSCSFKKIAEENFLLNELKSNSIYKKNNKILYAVTSYKNFLKLLEDLQILNARENLFIQEEIKKENNIQHCKPFLIFEEN